MSAITRTIKKTRQPKKLNEYYADHMIEEEDKPTNKEIKVKTPMTEESDQYDDENVHIEETEKNINIRKQNMDKISDILLSMLFKNKVNHKNAFDIPLPDVQQLSDFKLVTGDSSWKKLSQTLDAGAKIYGFRVDSVHNEAYKVLSSLNRTHNDGLNQNDSQEEIMVREEENQSKENHKKAEKSVKKQRKDLGGDSTLEKNLSNIDTTKYDMEFDIDPLFKKTSAKFDEGGARGLLLNTLSIDDQLNLMFDSTYLPERNEESTQETPSQAQRERVLWRELVDTLSGQREGFFTLKLCPELILFKQTYLKDAKQFKLDTQKTENSKMLIEISSSISDLELKFENIDFDPDRVWNESMLTFQDKSNCKESIRASTILDNDAQVIDQNAFEQDTDIPQLPPFIEEYNDTKDKELDFSGIEEKLAYLGFGQSLDQLIPNHLNWMGPEGWKLKVKKTQTKKKEIEKSERKEAKLKRESELFVDFNMSTHEDKKEVFGNETPSEKKLSFRSPKTPKRIEEPRPRQLYLLPLDMQIKPFRLTNLFQRGFNHRKEIHLDELENLKVEEVWDQWELDSDDVSAEQIDLQGQDSMQKSLDSIFRTIGITDPESNRREKYVNIKALKGIIWQYLTNKVPGLKIEKEYSDEFETTPDKALVKQEEEEMITFTDVYTALMRMLPAQQTRNLSVHSCLVTVLHLANERNLRFVSINNEDFWIGRNSI